MFHFWPELHLHECVSVIAEDSYWLLFPLICAEPLLTVSLESCSGLHVVCQFHGCKDAGIFSMRCYSCRMPFNWQDFKRAAGALSKERPPESGRWSGGPGVGCEDFVVGSLPNEAAVAT